MRLTWRDGVTTLLAVLVAGIYGAHVSGSAIGVVNDVRGATLLIGILGLSMCIVGGSAGPIESRSVWTVPLGALGVASFVFVLIGVVTAWEIAVPLLAVVTLLMWAIATLHHAAVSLTPRGV